MSARLTIRLRPALQTWTEEGGVEQADTARALMVIGAAVVGLPGADREALRLLRADLDPRIVAALADVAAKRQPSGSQAAATTEPTNSTPPEAAPAEELGDPFQVGIEV